MSSTDPQKIQIGEMRLTRDDLREAYSEYLMQFSGEVLPHLRPGTLYRAARALATADLAKDDVSVCSFHLFLQYLRLCFDEHGGDTFSGE